MTFLVISSLLIFKSSFNGDVYLTKPNRCNSDIWWQEIQDSNKSKLAWPITIKGADGKFQIIINNQQVDDYIENRIETTTDNNNNPIKALHQIIYKKEHDWTQDPYVIYTNDREQKRLYIKYSLKFPKNLAELLGKNGWLTFCEYKTKSDYRLAFYIYSDKHTGKLYWYVHSDNVVLKNKTYREYWFQENKDIDVPLGKWFDIEIFWNRSSKNNGRVWWAINKKIISDYHGRTKLKEPIHEIMLFTNYSNNPIHQWINNIEIWDNFPYK